MGMTSFLRRLETEFLNQPLGIEVSADFDVSDGNAVKQLVNREFGRWFLDHRDRLLAEEWVRRGWAEVKYLRDTTGACKQTYAIKRSCLEIVDTWLQDEELDEQSRSQGCTLT